MTEQDFHFPTPDEIDAHILAARKAQAQAMAKMVKAAFHWITHPRAAFHHA